VASLCSQAVKWAGFVLISLSANESAASENEPIAALLRLFELLLPRNDQNDRESWRYFNDYERRFAEN
jgi:hypothetical protein